MSVSFPFRVSKKFKQKARFEADDILGNLWDAPVEHLELREQVADVAKDQCAPQCQHLVEKIFERAFLVGCAAGDGRVRHRRAVMRSAC